MVLRSLSLGLPLCQPSQVKETCETSASFLSNSPLLSVSSKAVGCLGMGHVKVRELVLHSHTGRSSCKLCPLLGEWSPLSLGAGACGFGNLLADWQWSGLTQVLALLWKQQGGAASVLSQPEAAINVYEQNTTLLRCKLEMRQLQGGHNTQIGSELWHVNEAYKPGVWACSLPLTAPPARDVGTSLGKAYRSPEVRGLRGGGTCNCSRR